MNDRLRKIREESKLGMREFAERLGMSHSAISLLENGKRNPSSQFIKSVCREFNISEEWLKTGKGEMYSLEGSLKKKADQAAQLYGMDPDSFQYRLLTELLELSEEELSAVEDFMKRIINGGV